MSSTSSSTQNLQLNLPCFQDSDSQNVSTENSLSYYPSHQHQTQAQQAQLDASKTHTSNMDNSYNASTDQEERQAEWRIPQSSSSSLELNRYIRSEAPTPVLNSKRVEGDGKLSIEYSGQGDGGDLLITNDPLVESNVEKSTDSLLAETQMYMQQAEIQELNYKTLAFKANKDIYDLKISELDLQQELLLNGTLGDYQEQLQEIEAKKEENVMNIQDHLSHCMSSFEQVYQAQVKLALDTFSERQRILRKKLREKANTLQHQLRAEYGHFESKKKLPYISEFQVSASTIGKRKRLLFDQLSLGPGYTCDLSMPEWIRHVLKLRRRAGLDPVSVPNCCEGLDQVELEQDLSFLQQQLQKQQLVVDESMMEDDQALTQTQEEEQKPLVSLLKV